MQRKEPEFKSREQVLAFSPASSWLRDLGKEHNVSQPQFSHLPNGDNNTCVTGLFWEWDELMDIKLACVRLGFENLKAFILKMSMIKIYFILLLLFFLPSPNLPCCLWIYVNWISSAGSCFLSQFLLGVIVNSGTENMKEIWYKDEVGIELEEKVSQKWYLSSTVSAAQLTASSLWAPTRV